MLMKRPTCLKNASSVRHKKKISQGDTFLKEIPVLNLRTGGKKHDDYRKTIPEKRSEQDMELC